MTGEMEIKKEKAQFNARISLDAKKKLQEWTAEFKSEGQNQEDLIDQLVETFERARMETNTNFGSDFKHINNLLEQIGRTFTAMADKSDAHTQKLINSKLELESRYRDEVVSSNEVKKEFVKKLEDNQKSLEEMKKAVEAKDKTVGELAKNIARLEEQLADKRENIESLKKDLNKSNENLESFKNQVVGLPSIKEENEKLKSTVKDLRSKIEDLKRNHEAELKDKDFSKREEVLKTKDEMQARLEAANNRIVEEVDKRENALGELRKELEQQHKEEMDKLKKESESKLKKKDS